MMFDEYTNGIRHNDFEQPQNDLPFRMTSFFPQWLPFNERL
jgi:hypothetical protein